MPAMNGQLQIGDVTVPGRVLTAPMTGITDLPFRRVAAGVVPAQTHLDRDGARRGLHHRLDDVAGQIQIAHQG